MAQDPRSQLNWHHKPFGRRSASPQHPYFSIAHPVDPEDRDATRRRDLAHRAGLSLSSQS